MGCVVAFLPVQDTNSGTDMMVHSTTTYVICCSADKTAQPQAAQAINQASALMRHSQLVMYMNATCHLAVVRRVNT